MIGPRAWLGREDPSALPKPRPETARRAASYLRPYAGTVVVILVIVGIEAVLGLVPAFMIKQILDAALSPVIDLIARARAGGPPVDPALLARAQRLLFVFVGVLVASGVASVLLSVREQRLTAHVGVRIVQDLRMQLYRQLQRQSLRFFTDTRPGDIVSRLTNDIAGIREAMSGTVVRIVMALFTFVSTLALMLYLHPQLTLVSLAGIPLVIVPARLVGRVRQRLTRESQARLADVSTVAHETLSVNGMLLMRSFGRERYEDNRFERAAEALSRASFRSLMAGRWLMAVLRSFVTLALALLLLIGGNFILGGTLTVGGLAAIGFLLIRLYGPANQLAGIHVELMGVLGLFDRVFEYLDLRPEIVERRDAVSLERVTGRVRFRDVSFRYPTGGLVLDRVSFEIEPDHLIALVGPSGAGKTTITYLLARLYDVTEGAVEIDGVDVRDLAFDTIARAVGSVAQETYLFHASIRENLRYARLDAADDELWAACRAARVADLVAALPDGLDTVVGERGYRLSGGEKQRLAIARVILKDPQILVLDEATSHLDSESEAHVQAALESLMEGRTSLVIAHRLSTILSADQILVLEDGRIVERGAHAELLRQGGAYARLYAQQFRDVLVQPGP